MFFKNFDFDNRFKNEIEDNNEKIWSRFSDTVSQKNDFTADGLQLDNPPAKELNNQIILKGVTVRESSVRVQI